MFGAFIEDCIAQPDATLDERLRDNELALRQLTAEREALVAVAERRGVFAAEHRSMAGYLRATLNTSDASISRDRRLGRLLSSFPAVGDALWAGHISVDHALQITRVHANPRVRDWLPVVVPVLVELAEHTSHREFGVEVTNLIAHLDHDGTLADLTDAVESRRATVVEVGGAAVVSASGGDAVQASQLQVIFDTFVDAEYRRDVAARRARWGGLSDQHPLPRTRRQRCFDALVAIFSAAAASPEGRRLPEPVVNIVVDDATVHETLTHAGITLPNGDQLDLDETGAIVGQDAVLDGLAAELVGDPAAFLDRRCETRTGSAIHPAVVLRSLLTGHVRRAVVDSRGVIVDHGSKQRLFTGLARQAAMLLHRSCEFPGCAMPADWSHIDHNIEWHQGGTTDQHNTNVGCNHHNQLKHRLRWRTRRDARGRSYTMRTDGTIILAVGERSPDLTLDETTEAARARLAALIAQHAA